MKTGRCPVCESNVIKFLEQFENRHGNYYDCPNCGIFFMSNSALGRLADIEPWKKAGLSYQIWRNQGQKYPFEVFTTHLDLIRQEDLPGPNEQLENLILFWGQRLGYSFGSELEVSWNDLRSKLGAITSNDVIFVIDEAISRDLIKGVSADHCLTGVLTFLGWEEYRRIERGHTTSHHAFMAMPFGNSEVAQFVDEIFRPAVAETGFMLRRVDDEPKAGLIDNRIRVGIRMSRFLIADLTCENRGAYWEAGYAEGLSKPVIYTCNAFYFEHSGTHFDTNHCQTVLWDPNNPRQAADMLKATIRATLPFEARMTEEN
jgi:hypothetical protein